MSENQQQEASLFAKIAAIKGELKRLPKTGYNDFHKYAFATNGDVYDTVRNLLAEHRVALFAEIVSWEAVAQAKGYHVILQMRFTFACGDTGQTFTCLWAGESADSADKGFNKAMTAGTKYFLLSTFLISTGDAADDADSQSPDVGKAAAKPQQNKPATQQGKPANVSNIPQQKPIDADTTPWTAEQADKFGKAWQKEGYKTPEILSILGVKRLGEWKGSLWDANETMNKAMAQGA
jgi:hypothetical protein